jgi:hypothetical protein
MLPSTMNEDNPKMHIDELTVMARRDSIMFARCLWWSPLMESID